MDEQIELLNVRVAIVDIFECEIDKVRDAVDIDWRAGSPVLPPIVCIFDSGVIVKRQSRKWSDLVLAIRIVESY